MRTLFTFKGNHADFRLCLLLRAKDSTFCFNFKPQYINEFEGYGNIVKCDLVTFSMNVLNLSNSGLNRHFLH